jgi:hypothetical protein
LWYSGKKTAVVFFEVKKKSSFYIKGSSKRYIKNFPSIYKIA